MGARDRVSFVAVQGRDGMKGMGEGRFSLCDRAERVCQVGYGSEQGM